MTETQQLLGQLISRASVTPDDAGYMEIIFERLGRIGSQCEPKARHQAFVIPD